jgi:hypothetical protein
VETTCAKSRQSTLQATALVLEVFLASCQATSTTSYGGFHHGRLYNYQGPKWRTDKRPVRRVFFDPIPQEQYAPIAEEAGKPEVLHAMQKSDTEDSGANFVGLTIHETYGPWQEAVERDWATW